MMIFPLNPTLDQEFTSEDSRRWKWNGSAWQAESAPLTLSRINDFPLIPPDGVKVLQSDSGVVRWVDATAGTFETILLYPTRNLFPASGALKRLYIADDKGTLWRWTGTTYSLVAAEQDAGTY